MGNTFKTTVLLFVLGAWGFGFFSPHASAEEIYYDVPLIAQVHETSCWAASLQMILTYFREQSFSQESISKAVGFTLEDYYGWAELQKAIKYWEFCIYPSACLLPEGWREILKERGPLWVVRRTGEKITHAVVLKGMSEDTENPTMYVNDPWPVGIGDDKEMTYKEFEKVFEAVEEEQPNYLIQILYYCGKTSKS